MRKTILCLLVLCSGCKTADERFCGYPGALVVGGEPPAMHLKMCTSNKVRHGPVVMYWDPEGTLSVEGNFEDGRESGEWRVYDRTGALSKIETYSNGRMVASRTP